MPTDPALATLVLVDYQVRLLPALHDAEAAVREAVVLAQVARVLAVPVVGTEENPGALGPNDARVRALCDETLAKRHFDACGDGLVARLRVRRPAGRDVLLAGCETHVCLQATALGLLREGYAVTVVPGACASRRPGDKALAVQQLQAAGAALASVESVAFAWLRTCDHPRFREVLALVKSLPV
ncbi:MAG: isochorismatase family protein [Burkholderiales bacterium]